MGAGYTHCACRDCFDIAVSGDEAKPELCHACLDAGCAIDFGACCRSDAYGGDADPSACPDCGAADFHYQGCPARL